MKSLDAVAKLLTNLSGIERLTGVVYDWAGFYLDRIALGKVKTSVL